MLFIWQLALGVGVLRAMVGMILEGRLLECKGGITNSGGVLSKRGVYYVLKRCRIKWAVERKEGRLGERSRAGGRGLNVEENAGLQKKIVC